MRRTRIPCGAAALTFAVALIFPGTLRAADADGTIVVPAVRSIVKLPPPWLAATRRAWSPSERSTQAVPPYGRKMSKPEVPISAAAAFANHWAPLITATLAM